MTDLTLIQFPNRNLNDIPGMLRKLADDIEAGEYGEVSAMASVIESDDGMNAFGWGLADQMRCIGMFQTAATMLCCAYVEADE